MRGGILRATKRISPQCEKDISGQATGIIRTMKMMIPRITDDTFSI